jgi:recombinational DNA repair protein (RecF pathway)
VKAFKEELFLISVVPYRASDLVANLLSRRHGLLTATIYRGRTIGKSGSFPYHPGDLLGVEYQIREGRDFVQVVDTVGVRLLRPEAFSYQRFLFHCYLLELIRAISQPGDPAFDLFEILNENNRFHWPHSCTTAAMGWSLWRLVKHGGYEIDYHRCSRCGKATWRQLPNREPAFRKEEYGFDSNSGALYCRTCRVAGISAGRLTPAMIKACWLFDTVVQLSALPSNIPDEVAKPLIRQVNQYLLERFELSPRSLPQFLDLLR